MRILTMIKKILLLLQDALRQVDKLKPYRARPVNVNFIDHKKGASPQDSSATAGTQLKNKELFSIESEHWKSNARLIS
jgi:hypothetical protein